MKSSKITVLLLILILTPLSSWGFAGLLDYELDIGDGYRIYRNNSYEVCLGKSDGIIVLSQADYDRIGPITHYRSDTRHIFVRTIGLTHRLIREGPLPELDKSKEYYFIITKGTDAVTGPFSSIAFYGNPVVKAAGRIEWKQPKNPNILLPLLGIFLMLVYSVPVLFMRYPLQSISASLVLVFVTITVVRVLRRLRQRSKFGRA